MAILAKAEITISKIADIKKVITYYLLQSSTLAAPSKPADGAAIDSSWSKTEPSYTSGSTKTLYTVIQTTLSDGNVTYSEVSKSSSYEAAKEAWNKANNAQNSATNANNKIDGLKVGGRNLFRHSSLVGEELECDNVNGCNSVTSSGYEDEGYHLVTPDAGNMNNGIQFAFNDFTSLGLKRGDTITFSVDVKGTSDANKPFLKIWMPGTNPDEWWVGSESTEAYFAPTDEFQRISVTWTIPASEDIPLAGRICFGIHGNIQSDLYIRNLKLERGTMATDWTPAPEDTDAKITEEIDTAITKGKDDILLTVKDTYTAKTEYDGKIQSIEAWQSAASQKLTKDGITAIVGSYYTTSEDFNDLTKRVTLSETSISQNADEIKLRVKSGEIISTINQSAEAIQISADKVNLAGYVTISSLAGSGTTTIDGSNIKTGTIDSDRISAKSITADKISVDSLQSISASIGGFTIDDTAIYKGSAALGTSGNGNIYLGDAGFSLSDKLKYDVADGSLAISGKVTATEGTIGGFTIGKTSLYSGTTALGAIANSVYLGTDGISCGDRFKVDKAGNLTIYSDGGTADKSFIKILEYGTSGKYNTYISAGYIAMTNGGDVKTVAGKRSASLTPTGFHTLYQWNAGGAEAYAEPGHIYSSDLIEAGGEVRAGVTTANAFRAVYGNYGFIIRNDGTNTYLMTTKSGDPYGTWNKFITIRNDTCNTVFPGDVSVTSTLTASTVKIKYKYWFTDAYTQEKAITATWKDGAGHDLCHIDADGLTCYYGWAGSTAYKTVTVVRGQTVRYKNASGTTTLSDERLKHGFKSLDEYDEAYMDINPCAFQYNAGASGRYHFGASAQQVKLALEKHGFTTYDFAGLVQTEDNPGSEDYCGVPDPWGLIYTEFTMWNMHMTQKALKEIQALKERINTQQYMLEQVMARLSKLEKAS